MIPRLIRLWLIITTVIFFSCKKSNTSSGNSTQLAGSYQFLYLSAVTSSVGQESSGGLTEKDVTNTDYTTAQNTGTMVFTTDSINSVGLGYTANTTATAYEYDNGVLADSLTFPFSVTVAPSNSTTKYEVIGQDSIYFEGGYLTSGLGASSTISPPSGGRFSFKGDTLFIISTILQTTPPQSSGGITISSSASAVATIVLLKQ